MTDIPGLITSAANQYGVDPGFAMKIAQAESSLNPSAVSPAGAIGVMQLMPGTAKGLGVDPHDLTQNIQGGVRYIRQLQDQFGNNPQLVAAAYNAGPGAVVKHGGIPDYPETQAYVRKVTGQAPTGSQGGQDGPGLSVGDFYHLTGLSPPGSPSGASAPTTTQGSPSASNLSVDDFYKQSGLKPPVAPNTPAPSATPTPGPLQQVRAGATEALTGMPEFLAGALGFGPQSASGAFNQSVTAHDPKIIALARAHGTDPNALAAQIGNQYSFSHLANTALGALGLNPETVPAPTPASRIERAAGGGLVNMLFPGGEAKTVLGGAARLGASALEGIGIGAGAQTATEAAPAPLKPLAGIAGGGAVALATHGGASALRGGRSALDGVTAPFSAAVSDTSAQRQAAVTLSKAATDLPQVRNALEGTTELVPGSTPTTFQATGDMGLGALERGAAAKAPQLFKERQAEQNAARVNSLQSVQQGADPVALARGVTDQFGQIDAQTDAAVRQATQAAQGAAEQIGGTAPVSASGFDLRSAISAAQDAAKAQIGKLYDAVDPDGTLTGNNTATIKAAKDIPQAMATTAKPMSGEEADIFTTAQQMNPISPVQDLIALRSRVSTAMRQELIASGSSPTYARLSQLRGAIEQNLNSSIQDKITNDNSAVASGQLPASRSAATRLQQVLADARAAGQSVSFGGSKTGNAGGVPSSPAPEVAGVGGADVPSTGGLGSAPWNPPVPGGPTFDDAARQRLDAATTAYKAERRTFGLKPVGPLLAKNGAADLFKMPDGSVPGQFFHKGPNGFEHMQAAIKAGGDAAMPILEDYAAADLRKAAQNPDGTIDPAKYGRWRAANADALRAFPPETQGRFSSAANATQAVADAAESRAEALKNFKVGALGKLIGVTDPDAVSRVVGNALGSTNRVAEMRALAASAKNDPEAMAGLRQAVADHITRTLISNTEAGTSGVNLISADKFQSFIKQNRAALAEVFTSSELDRMDAIAADINRANRSNNALKLAGSNTTQDILAATKGPKVGARVGVDILGSLLGNVVGEHFHIPGGEVAGVIASEWLQRFRAAGIGRVNDLVTQALLNPRIARELLAGFPDNPSRQAATFSKLMTSLAKATGVSAVASRAQSPGTAPTALTGVPLSRTSIGKSLSGANALTGF